MRFFSAGVVITIESPRELTVTRAHFTRAGASEVISFSPRHHLRFGSTLFALLDQTMLLDVSYDLINVTEYLNNA